MPDAQPSVLGLKPSFGFGDRLGLATPGHIRACRRGGLVPIFAQQSVREMDRTGRTPADVMQAARDGIASEGWSEPWGADADHLKTRADVVSLADAGFTFFTIDPSEHVDNGADAYDIGELDAAVGRAVEAGAFESGGEIASLYSGREHDLGDAGHVKFDKPQELLRAVAKYGRAIAYTQQMAGWIAEACGENPYEIEVSVDETDTPTTPLEHLFIALELRRRGVNVVSLAPRFVGDFEKGIDYKGDVAEFEETLRLHVAIAREFGPYKLSVHSGSDKFSIYPICGRVCGDLLHVKTAGTSYLEALRVVARVDAPLFREIVEFSLTRFDVDRATYHISADLARVTSPSKLSETDREREYLDIDDGRQVLHVTFGSVLTDATREYKPRIMDILRDNPGLHADVLESHLGRHIELLTAG
jgi:tagaturonate epimerase